MAKTSFVIVIQISTVLVSQIGTGISITNYLYVVVDLDGTMIGGDHHFSPFFGNVYRKISRSAECSNQAHGERTVCRIVIYQFANHLHIGCGHEKAYPQNCRQLHSGRLFIRFGHVVCQLSTVFELGDFIVTHLNILAQSLEL